MGKNAPSRIICFSVKAALYQEHDPWSNLMLKEKEVAMNDVRSREVVMNESEQEDCFTHPLTFTLQVLLSFSSVIPL
jgi:hypothetical protein